MKRRGLIRFQLLLLVALAAVVVIRVAKGPPPPEGLVVLFDLEPNRLSHQAFELLGEADVVVQATGSLDQEAMPAGLAAQGWILRHEDRQVVWEMNPRQVERGRGSLAHVAGDTLRLEAGLYDVFFASYGQAESSRGRPRWYKDSGQWQVVVNAVDEAVPARVLNRRRLEPVETMAEQLIWAARAIGNEEKQAHLFEVKQPTQLEIHAVGEIDEKQRDYAWIENVETEERVWALTRDNTEPAGGLASNRRFQGTVAMQPGIYRAVVETNSRHAFRRWRGNPPYDPAAWGIALYAKDTDAVVTFDAWDARQPVISFMEVENRAEHNAQFEVTTPTSVLIDGIGEMTGPGNVHDFATLFKGDADNDEVVWAMTWETSVQAGGDKKNRRDVKVLNLEPGRYTFRYETDGSHAFESWNASKPANPERWGATLFAEASRIEDGSIRLVEEDEEEALNAAPAHAGEALVAWTQLTGTVEYSSDLIELEDETRLHIVALGEITDKGQHDFGWIEEAGSEETVWEMTLENTSPAGGDDRNRRFDEVVTLPPGQYIVHYITDSSHHYDSFAAEGPEDPEAWGITIYYVADEDANPFSK